MKCEGGELILGFECLILVWWVVLIVCFIVSIVIESEWEKGMILGSWVCSMELNVKGYYVVCMGVFRVLMEMWIVSVV